MLFFPMFLICERDPMPQLVLWYSEYYFSWVWDTMLWTRSHLSYHTLITLQYSFHPPSTLPHTSSLGPTLGEKGKVSVLLAPHNYQMLSSLGRTGGVTWWSSGLKIWWCQCCGSGHCCGTSSVPGPGNSTGHRCGKNKQTNKQKHIRKDRREIN